MSTASADLQEILDSIPGLYRGPGGAVAIIRDGELQAQKVWGMADLDRRIPLTSKTAMPICSISKQFLCLVLADLDRKPTDLMKKTGGTVWEQLAKELANMLPHVVNHKDGKVAVANLYNMQSGIRDYWAETVLWGAKPDDPFSIADDAPRTLERTKSLHFKPGTEFSYCNVNFHVLGKLTEKVSGHSLGQLFAERVFIPAGMSTAALYPNTAAPPLPIIGYEGDEKTRGYFPAVNRLEWAGDAGICASLEDMIKYEQYLERSWSDSSSNYRTIAEPQTYNDGSPAMYGFGLMRAAVAGKTTLGHGGGLRGFRLQRTHVPSEHLSVLVMFNHEAASGAASELILKRAMNIQDPEPKPSTVKPAAEWKGNFLDEETQLLIKVTVSDTGEIALDFGMGQEKMTTLINETHAERQTMTASIDGDVLSAYRNRDNRHYRAKRIDEPNSSSASTTNPQQYFETTATYEGSYHSADLDSTFHCTNAASNNLMYAFFEGFLGKGPSHLMRYVGEDVWTLACPRSLDAPAPGDWTVVFKKGKDGKVEGVTVGCWLARKVEYVRKDA